MVAGLGGLALVVALGLRPAAREAAAIAEHYSLSLDALSQLRGDIVFLRDAATRFAAAKPGGRRALVRGRAAAAASAQRYARAPLLPEEAAARRLLAAQMEQLDQLAAALLAQASPSVHGTLHEDIRAAASHADVLAEQLVRLNGDLTRSTSARIDASLRRLGWTTVALAGLGGLAALILLRVALQAVERHAAETELRAAEMEAFAARVAHDLRTPLQTVRLSIELIAHSVTDPRALETCQRAQRNVVGLGRFIDDLLEFSRAGARPDESAAADVGEVLQGLSEQLGARAAEIGAALRLDAEPGLAVAMAPGAFRAVAANLTENALKYLGDAPERRVEVTARGDGTAVVLTVRDTGPGVPAEVLPHLFEMHYRGNRRTAGHGMGLATVKRLVDAHSGEVTVESEPGRGATFTVRLPRLRAEAAQA